MKKVFITQDGLGHAALTSKPQSSVSVNNQHFLPPLTIHVHCSQWGALLIIVTDGAVISSILGGSDRRKGIALEQLNAWSKATYVRFFPHNAVVRISERPPFNQHGPGYSALPSLCQKAENREYLATLTVTDILIFACEIISLMTVLST